MAKKNEHWKKGRGKLGIMTPLLGSWRAEVETPVGKASCTRTFHPVLSDKYIELKARWEFSEGVYEEYAIYGFHDGKISFWSFTSDGKKSDGTLADGSDIHPEAICFEANIPAGLARMTYWPHEKEGINFAVEAKTKKGWSRFAEHYYLSV